MKEITKDDAETLQFLNCSIISKETVFKVPFWSTFVLFKKRSQWSSNFDYPQSNNLCRFCVGPIPTPPSPIFLHANLQPLATPT